MRQNKNIKDLLTIWFPSFVKLPCHLPPYLKFFFLIGLLFFVWKEPIFCDYMLCVPNFLDSILDII